MIVGIETSSYIPLLMNTPNTIGLLKTLKKICDAEEKVVIMHKDSVREALLQFQIMRSPWSDDPAHRSRWLAENLSDSELNRFRFPEDAFRILIGGNIGPPFFGYLNYTRLCGFLYASVIHELDYSRPPRQILLQLAEYVEKKRDEIRNRMKEHCAKKRVRISTHERYTCWGPFYMKSDLEFLLTIEIMEDIEQDYVDLEKGRIDLRTLRQFKPGQRDAYHYAMMLAATPRPNTLVVADSGFKTQVKNHLGDRIARLIGIRRVKTHRPDYR